MTLMAFGANETPIEHAGLVYLFILSLCPEACLFFSLGLHECGLSELLGEEGGRSPRVQDFVTNIERQREGKPRSGEE